MSTPRSQLTSIITGVLAGLTGTLIALIAFAALSADADPGDTDTTYIPITACRLIDTRPDNAFGPNQTRTLTVHGTNGACTIPTDATGMSLNITALRASELTFLTIWPDGPLPNASSLNPAPGEPPTPNAVTTPLSATGSFNIYNSTGTVHIIVDITGYYTKTSLHDLHTRLTTLETANTTLTNRVAALESADTGQLARITALETKTDPISNVTVDGHPTVRFTGVNVQIVDGTGDTDGDVNGKGNLIVGYNENSSDTRTGSHNLIVGPDHTYTSFGGLIAGRNNNITGPYASVTGGANNTASGYWSSVTGGAGNWASADWSSVTGGNGNTASGNSSAVTGGLGNVASEGISSVTGGADNIASGYYSSVTGGSHNTAGGYYSSVSGGQYNAANGHWSTVSGGFGDSVAGMYDWRAGDTYFADE